MEQEREKKKLDELMEETNSQYTAVQKSKSEVQQKEQRLDEERKSMRKERDSNASRMENELKRMSSQGMTKMLVSSAICFILGVGVAMTILNTMGNVPTADAE